MLKYTKVKIPDLYLLIKNSFVFWKRDRIIEVIGTMSEAFLILKLKEYQKKRQN
jgi:hypothetical protein